MKTLQKPRTHRLGRRAPLTMPELQQVMSHVIRLLLHTANRRTLTDPEYSYHYDAVLAALAGWRSEPYASMDDREEPDGTGSPPAHNSQGGDER